MFSNMFKLLICLFVPSQNKLVVKKLKFLLKKTGSEKDPYMDPNPKKDSNLQ